MDYLTAAAASIATCGGLALGWDQLSTLLDVSAKYGWWLSFVWCTEFTRFSGSCHQFSVAVPWLWHLGAAVRLDSRSAQLLPRTVPYFSAGCVRTFMRMSASRHLWNRCWYPPVISVRLWRRRAHLSVVPACNFSACPKFSATMVSTQPIGIVKSGQFTGYFPSFPVRKNGEDQFLCDGLSTPVRSRATAVPRLD